MKKIIILLCLLVLNFVTYSQSQYTPMTATGYQEKRLKVDSSLHIPSFCGIPTLRNSTAIQGALAMDTCNNKLYKWTRANGWSEAGGGGGSQDLQSVLDSGNFSYNKDINLYGKTSQNQIYLSGMDNNYMPFMALGDSIGGAISLFTYPQATIEFINKYQSQKLKQQDSIRGIIYLPAQTIDATDTLAMLSDVRAVSGGIDTTSLSNRINQKINISDSAAMLLPYLKKLDTASLSNRINQKINISDSAAMLSTYLRAVDTTNKWVTNITRIAGKDSIIFYKGPSRFAIKDSVGSGGSSQNGRFGNDTATIVMVKVHNDAGVTLTNGKVVALTTSGNNNEAPAVRLANSKGDSTSANTLGFVSGTIANQDTGWVILSGKIEKVNTAAYSNGDIIYLDTISGNFTKNKPSAPVHLVYLGVVVKSNGGNGSIFVKAQNGYELDEIHDVQINSKVNNQILAYSDTQKVWKNRNIYSIIDTTTTIATKTNVAAKVNISDTAAMLTKYMEYVDSVAMLSKYLRKSDTLTLSNRIDAKLNSTDTASLSTRINAKGYAINIGCILSGFSLSTTYYFGTPVVAASTTQSIRRVYIPQSGTIKAGYLYAKTTGATSTENWTLSIRLNATTSTTFATVANALTDKVFSNTALNISVNAGDYIEITTATPAWSTAAGNTTFYGTLIIQ